MTYLLEINSLTKSFNRKKTLSNISFNLKESTIIGLEGHNGSGKTTLFKIISGIMKPDSGDGKLINIPIFTSNYKYRKHLVYWSHNPQFYASLTGYENLELFLKLRSESNKINLINNFADKYELSTHLNKEIREYSYGQIQRLKLIQLSISNWKLALLDEPESGMDQQGKVLLKKMIEKSRINGKTILISSHNKDWLNDNTDGKFILSNNKLKND